MPRLLDPAFKYVPAAKTDIRLTIRREIARLKAEKEAQAQKVTPMRKAGR